LVKAKGAKTSKIYHALITSKSGPNAGTLLHLIREDAEASLCGIPRSSLRPGGIFDEIVCSDCLDWLPKRQEASRKMRRVSGEGWKKAAT